MISRSCAGNHAGLLTDRAAAWIILLLPVLACDFDVRRQRLTQFFGVGFRQVVPRTLHRRARSCLVSL